MHPQIADEPAPAGPLTLVAWLTACAALGCAVVLALPGALGLALPLPGDAYQPVAAALATQAFLLVLGGLALQRLGPSDAFLLKTALLSMALIGLGVVWISLAAQSLLAWPHVNPYVVGLAAPGFVSLMTGLAINALHRARPALHGADGHDTVNQPGWKRPARVVGGLGAFWLRQSIYLCALLLWVVACLWLYLTLSLPLLKGQAAPAAWHWDRLGLLLNNPEVWRLLNIGPVLALALTVLVALVYLTGAIGRLRQRFASPDFARALSPAEESYIAHAAGELEEQTGQLRGTMLARLALLLVIAISVGLVALGFFFPSLEQMLVVPRIDRDVQAVHQPILVVHEALQAFWPLLVFLFFLAQSIVIALSWILPRWTIAAEAALMTPGQGFSLVERAVRARNLKTSEPFAWDRFLTSVTRSRFAGMVVGSTIALASFVGIYVLDRSDYAVFANGYIETGEYWTRERTRWSYGQAKVEVQCAMAFGRPQPGYSVVLPDQTRIDIWQAPIKRFVAIDRRLMEAGAAVTFAEQRDWIGRIKPLYDNTCVAMVGRRTQANLRPLVFALLRTEVWYKQRWLERTGRRDE